MAKEKGKKERKFKELAKCWTKRFEHVAKCFA